MIMSFSTGVIFVALEPLSLQCDLAFFQNILFSAASLTLVRMNVFGTAHGWGGGKKLFMISAKMATPDLLAIKSFWRKVYDVIISVHDVTNKILSCDSNYNVKNLNFIAWFKT